MSALNIVATEEALAYIERIANEIALLFPIDMIEAVGRINRFWAGQEFLSETQVGVLLHEEPDAGRKRLLRAR
jgi:hypothetical protein